MSATPAAPTLTLRQLNRATLARQLLLKRVELPVAEVVELHGGFQAQTTHTWYVGLWCRLRGFDPVATGRMLETRELVRIGLQRATIHLVTADDALWLRPLLAPVLTRPVSSFARNLVGVDRDAVADASRELLRTEPLTWAELGRRLEAQWPGRDPASLAQVARAQLALVQIPPRGVWGKSGQALHAPLEQWLGRPLEREPSVDRLVLRYLAAFGPASPKDAQAWCGLTRLAAVFERLRPQLATFRDEDGRELFDLPDAPRPDPDIAAPVRFLYDYDNLLLSHADRSRFHAPGGASAAFDLPSGVAPGILLVDGVVRGTWLLARERGAATTLTVRVAGRLTKRERAEVEAEGDALLTFLAPDADERRVELVAV